MTMMRRWTCRMIVMATLTAGLGAPAFAQSSSPAKDLPCAGPGLTPPAAANAHVMQEGDYPLLSMILGEQGVTVLKFLIKSDGTVTDAGIDKSSGSMRLDDTAKEVATERWLYKPATADGKPVACPWKVQVVWKMSRPDGAAPGSISSLKIEMSPEDYPPDARARGEEGIAVLLAAVGNDGSLQMVAVVRSSGFADLDAASMALLATKIKSLNPQPPPQTLIIVNMVWSLKLK